MSIVSTSISIDENTRNQAQALLSEFGMDLSTAINIFLKQMIYEGAFPLVIHREIPNEETRTAIENVRNGIGLSRPFYSVQELMEDLDADD